ncbi:hypothetical protein GUJ93_ZPchr0006g44428 [Zizania palustris]|uniref:Uncharacterized protein n=1 Tax=Zizania palustris TaxID=103762 RepID=A0A8J5W1M7_ZIZPA|nr:hypothetical protein GUJ93_ZPchr0006g44428 [Zizania palustris]
MAACWCYVTVPRRAAVTGRMNATIAGAGAGEMVLRACGVYNYTHTDSIAQARVIFFLDSRLQNRVS